MKYPKKIRKIAVLFTAFSFCWIFVGSLILFHEERILGKDFKLQYSTFVAPKSKDENKVLKSGPVVKNLNHSGNQFLDAPAITTELLITCPAGKAKKLLVHELPLLTQSINLIAQLRAPPVF